MNSQLTKITKDLRTFLTVRNNVLLLNNSSRYYSNTTTDKSKIQVQREKATQDKQETNQANFILDNLDIQYDKNSYNKHYTNDLGKKFMSPYSGRQLNYYPTTLEFLTNGYAATESLYAVENIKELGVKPAPRKRIVDEDEEDDEEEDEEHSNTPPEVDITRVRADYVDEMPRVEKQSLLLIKRLGKILHNPLKHKAFYLMSLDQQKFFEKACQLLENYDQDTYDESNEDQLLQEYAALVEKMTERQVIREQRQRKADENIWKQFSANASVLVQEMRKAKIDVREAIRSIDLMDEFKQLHQQKQDKLEHALAKSSTIPQEQEDEKLTYVAAVRPGDDLLFTALYDASPVIRQQFDDFVELVEKMIKQNELAPFNLEYDEVSIPDEFESWAQGEDLDTKELVPLLIFVCERIIAGFQNTAIYRAGPQAPAVEGQLTYDQVCDWIKLFRYFRARGMGFIKYEEKGVKEPVKTLAVSVEQEMAEFFDFINLYKRYSTKPHMFKTFFNVMLYAKWNPKNFGASFYQSTLRKSEKEYLSYEWPDTASFGFHDITIHDLFDPLYRPHIKRNMSLLDIENDEYDGYEDEQQKTGAAAPPGSKPDPEENDEDLQDMLEFLKEVDKKQWDENDPETFFPDIEPEIEPSNYKSSLFKDRGYSDAIAEAQSDFLESASNYFAGERGKELTGFDLDELNDNEEGADEDEETGVAYNEDESAQLGNEGEQEQDPMDEFNQDDGEKDEFEDDQLGERFEGGRSQTNVYRDVPVLDISNIVNVARHVKVTKAGRVNSFSCTVFNGNGNGTASLGYGKGDSPAVALKRASRDAERNAFTLDRYKGVTLPSDLELHYRSTTIKFFKSRPIDQIDTRGHKQGIILPTLGLHGVNFRTYGRRKWANVLLTMQRRLEDFTNPEEAARLMGKKLVTHNSQKEKKKTLSELLQSKIHKKNTDPYNIGLVKDFLYDMERPNKEKIRDRKIQQDIDEVLDNYPKDQEDSDLYTHKSTKFGQHLYTDTKQVDRMK
ncbi:hypothetical protein CYY_005335 [Polysphondylium violaceum]|uniref:S5 DRBM domain-containing protein n=1 Tax=Polysphondylium violaceum TaxID=133409 RepID=A0A8J4PWT6_9MYCE|nr:hypothetical protein CYY_005335 [Polysphondylium violaceum]